MVLSGSVGGALGAVLGTPWVIGGFSAGVILALIACFASDFGDNKSKVKSFEYGKEYESSFNRRAAW